MEEKIDVVISYLDEKDPAWQADFERFSGLIESRSNNGAARYRSMENFQYVLRSIEQYMPWVNRIFIVTYGHVPAWLNLENPKLKIVKHSDFMAAEDLPTFHSGAIELNFDRISGLSEQFIYFNDDMFLNGTVLPSDFFRNALPVMNIQHAPAATYAFTQMFTNIFALNRAEIPGKVLLSKKSFSLKNGWLTLLSNLYMAPLLLAYGHYFGFRADHLPYAMTKKLYAQARAAMPEEFRVTSALKFRTASNNLSISIWAIQDLARATEQFECHNSYKFGKECKIAANLDYAKLLASKKKVLCLNDSDELSTEEFEREKRRLNQALAQKFPKKSSFEK